MLFTWSTQDLCLVFSWWHIRSTASLVFSLLAVVALAAGYEAIRELARRFEARAAAVARRNGAGGITGGIAANTHEDIEPASINEYGRVARRSLRWLGGSRLKGINSVDVIRATLYATQVFYSFFVMLLFMTYNGWVMIAVAVGAFVGHITFGLKTTSEKTIACH